MIDREGSRRLTVIAVLGFASGLPLALTDSTLQAWLTLRDVDVTTIGLFSLVSLPYVVKFFWAPFLDRFQVPFLGRRRGWIAAMQLLIPATIILLAFQQPESDLVFIAWLALLLAFLSATQDIAIDAYRAEILHSRERGIGAGLSVTGYRIGMIVSGAGAFVIADKFGFSAAYCLVAALLMLVLLVTFVGREPVPPQEIPKNFHAVVVEPLASFMKQPQALALISFVCLYKLGDATAARLSTTFFVRHMQFSLTEVGAIYKGLGVGASLAGGLIGGALMYRIGLFRALLYFGILQAVSNAGFLFLAVTGKSIATMIAVISIENLSGGMGTTALVALLMALCDRRYTATQFALLSAAASLGRVLSGPPAGTSVEYFGWMSFYAATILLTIPAIILLFRLRSRIDELDDIHGA